MPERNRPVRLAIVCLTALFAVSIAIQIYIAGMAVFIDAAHWKDHTNFVHIIELMPIAIFILSFFGRARGTVRWLPLAMFGLIILQYATAHLNAKLPYFSALHPLIAVILLWMSLYTLKHAYRLWRG
ncbi:DUF6220 domain-containing protein [Paenibacillus montanisoli]|uniref:Uncharacterized protein n=1 Tax=Paenibacillus montanisoli TaxID=2081970 RepID=A0A328TZ89_9BACL|nr:DUF6220 domain-containing protein [Paenibacillus montanisoli]RAP74451.1 hypothetical protein DL346_20480 [Paenibacillus montanisoli]